MLFAASCCEFCSPKKEKRIWIVMRGGVLLAVPSVLLLLVLLLHRRWLKIYQERIQHVRTIDDTKVTMNIWSGLRHMTGIALPTVFSREGLGTLMFIILFALKAITNVVKSKADGLVIEAMLNVYSKGATFKSARTYALCLFAGSSLLSSMISGGIEHLRFYLIASYREKLTHYFHRKYFHKLTFYHASVLDDRLENADTVITHYCHEFAEHFAELPYYFILPLFEAGSALATLVAQVGSQPAALMSSAVLLSLGALKELSPQFGKIHAALLDRSESFRRLHNDVSTNVEQVAMHDAGDYTRRRLNKSFSYVQESLEHMALAKGHFVILENVISGCAWDVIGFLVSGQLIAAQRTSAKSRSSLLSAVVVQRRLIQDFHSGVKAFVVNFKEMSHLCEFTEKLSTFDGVLDSIARGEFHRTPDKRFILPDGTVDIPQKEEYLGVTDPSYLSLMSPMLGNAQMVYSGNATPMASQTTNETEPLIELERVNVSTPNGVLLVKNLNVMIHYGQNWVVTGPNGCGKSSLLRILAGMWMPTLGKVTISSNVEFFFLPQDAYMLNGCTLVEQIFFPKRPSFERGGVLGGNDSALSKPMQRRVKESLQLATGSAIVTEVIGDWDSPEIGFIQSSLSTEFEWDSLSGGQKQKIALARLFFHAEAAIQEGKVPIAVMDESTSQMDHEAEMDLFENLKHKKIHCISVTHRPEVIQYHDRTLKLGRTAEKWSVQRPRENHVFHGYSDSMTASEATNTPRSDGGI